MASEYSTLEQKFYELCQDFSFSSGITSKLLSCIPQDMGNTVAFKDSLNQEWKYDFGNYIPDIPQAIGSHTFPKIRLLFDALRTCEDRLTSIDFQCWCSRLFGVSQHLSTLEETAPIFHLQDDVGIFFEVPTTGQDVNVDWELIVPSAPPILLEVKLRRVDLAHHMEKVARGARGSDLKPEHDANDIFAKLEHKFYPADPRERLQGAWIATWLKQEKSEIQAAFNRLDPLKIHFVLLVSPGTSRKSGYLLAQPGVFGQTVLNVFGLNHDPSKVFHRNG